jgi:hypothetical protein
MALMQPAIPAASCGSFPSRTKNELPVQTHMGLGAWAVREDVAADLQPPLLMGPLRFSGLPISHGMHYGQHRLVPFQLVVTTVAISRD